MHHGSPPPLPPRDVPAPSHAVQPSIVSCAVTVVCELARKKPSNYLSLAPELFTLLTGATNNWMLIKVAKLLGALVQEEPRLARKLLEPLANIVQSTPAKSLMFEVRGCACGNEAGGRLATDG